MEFTVHRNFLWKSAVWKEGKKSKLIEEKCHSHCLSQVTGVRVSGPKSRAWRLHLCALYCSYLVPLQHWENTQHILVDWLYTKRLSSGPPNYRGFVTKIQWYLGSWMLLFTDHLVCRHKCSAKPCFCSKIPHQVMNMTTASFSRIAEWSEFLNCTWE